MNAIINEAVQELNARIDQLQEARRALLLVQPIMDAAYTLPLPPANENPPTPPLPVKWKRKAKVGPVALRPPAPRSARRATKTESEPDRGDARPTSAAPPAVKLNLDKPKSLGAAMKALIRNQTRFTGEALRGLLLADPDTKELMEQNNGGLLGANLNYWAKQGYLDKTGEGALEATYTVVKREWFAA